jgi:hypothetical protein
MNSLKAGLRLAGLKSLSYADTDSGAKNFQPDSFTLILPDRTSIMLTSGTDWTLQIEVGTWPDLPDWAWPPESWQYQDIDTPIGQPGFDTVRSVTMLRNEVGEINGVRIAFDQGRIEFVSGESTSYTLTR